MTNYPSLFEQFLSEECTPEVRKLVTDAAAHPVSARSKQEFEFNRFDLVLDFDKGTATIQDVTDTSDNGSMSVTISELLEKVRSLQ
jgi:hypothetical protein